jgi:multicomponent Na+:H+ antiporter subunit B
MNSLILRTAAHVLTGLMLIVSLFLLLRGHNEPGGGFLGGLVAASAFVVLALAGGTHAVRAALRIEPANLALIGLAVAIAAGLAGAFFGDPFLTGLWTFVGAEPGSKGLALGTPLLFDLGVYLVVVGAVVAILLALEEEV